LRSRPRRFVSSPASQPRPLAPGASGPRGVPIATGADTLARLRMPRRLVVVGGLTGIGIASFVIALLVCSPQREPAPDAPAVAAAAADAPPADGAAAGLAADAAPAPAPAPDAPAPAPGVDAGPRLQLYKVDTRPAGGTVQIDDQRQIAPAEFMLPAGKHTVVAELDGWQPETRPIEIVEGVDLTHEIPFTRRLHIVRTGPTGTLTVRTTPYS